MPRAATGRPKSYCGQTCRKRASRRVGIPRGMISRVAWTRRVGKRPVMVDGSPASSTDPTTWDTFVAVQSGAGDGFGVMLGGGLACYDLDHCFWRGDLAVWARRVVESIDAPILWVERSMSGDGVHVFVQADDDARSYRRNGVEFYAYKRFIAVTGDRYTL